MSNSLAVHDNHQILKLGIQPTFWSRFQKHVKLEILTTLSIISFLCRIFMISLIALLVFILGYIQAVLGEHEIIKKILSPVLPAVITYYAGTYLTLLPGYLILVLFFIPEKARYPILGLSFFFSLFILFLV